MTGTRPRRLCWTALGKQMGYTSEPAQREQLLAAVARMTWTADVAAVPYLNGDAVRAIVAAVFGRRHRALRRVGVAQLNGRQLLIGLEHRDGERAYLLDLDSVAVYVLADTSQPPAQPQHRVA